MKKILGLITGLILTAFTYGQATASFMDANAEYNKATATSFHFVFSPVHTEEAIKDVASSYESYFTVTTTPNGSAGNKVTIKLVEDDEMSRRVILRLLASLEIGQVNVNGTVINRDEFVNKYIIE